MSSGFLAQRVLAAVLAWVGPLVVLSSTVVLLWGWTDAEERQALANAGKVLNARVANEGDVVAAMERLLRQHEPEVLLLGPSYANTDVDPDLLATRLGLARSKVVLFSVPNSVGAHWYAILQNRIFAAGHRPTLVVVVSGLQSMLLATPLTESSFLNLAVHLDGPDPVLDAKVQRSTKLALARLREKRGLLRDAFFGLLRDLPPRLFVRSPKDPSVGVRPFEVRAALDRVFDDARVDMGLHVASTPIAAFAATTRTYEPSMLPSPAASFVPDITRLVRDHGARMIWVRPPMSPEIPDTLDDVVPPGFQEEVVGMVHALGGSFVDMRGLPMSSDMFKNPDHMNAEGSRRFTEALAKALLDLDALAPDRAPDTLPPLAPVVEVVGQPGDVPEPASSWSGEGTWVGPGATLRVTLAEGWDPLRGPLAVRVLAEQLGRAGDAPELVAGGRWPLVASDGNPQWRVWRLDRVLAAAQGPVVVEVQVPEGAAWVRITGLALGEGAGRVVILGRADSIDGVRAPLFGVFRYQDGVLVDETVHPTYLTPLPKVPGADRAVEEGSGRIGRYDTARWEFLSDERLIGETNFGSRCSPLRIAEDGAILPHANVPCVEVQRRGEGRSCHTPESIYFTTVDGSDPRTNGRTYRLVLDEGRRCDGAVWLYPKDRFRVAWPTSRLAPFRRGADTLEFGARYLQKRPTKVILTLMVDGEERLREAVSGTELQGKLLRFPIDPPVPPTSTDVVLEVENTDLTFYLVEAATLVEGG